MTLSIRNIALGAMLTSMLAIGTSTANAQTTLSFSDNRPQITELHKINNTLHTIGVHLSNVDIPQEAKTILGGTSQSKLNEEQQSKILKIFSLNRNDVLNQIHLAGRKPVVAEGGSLSTREVGVPPYPKIYDLISMTPQDHINAENKFGKLHVNSAENDQGVDEVMTLISGGPWTWFFLLDDNVVVKLSMDRVSLNGPGWRISYPGTVPHGAFMDAEDGICVAYITGPETWLMRYESPMIKGAKLLGTNPWIDFSSQQPILLNEIKK